LLGDGRQFRQIVQVGGQPHREYLQFHGLVKNLPNTFFSDDSEPTFDDEAVLLYSDPEHVISFSQYQLLAAARGSADAQGISGNHSLMNVHTLVGIKGIVNGLLTALWTGATLVLNADFRPGDLWRRMTAERAHIVSLDAAQLESCLRFAEAQQARGEPIWGDGIHQQDMTHIRHVLCSGADTALLRAFEERFGLMVLHGYSRSETAGYAAFMPIDLDWKAHQAWLFRSDDVCVGCPIEGVEMTILGDDGRTLDEGEVGELCLRSQGLTSSETAFRAGWFHTGDRGYYQRDVDGRPFFYLKSAERT
jgi:acyl-CoA synthetase (AMP-forming)/AMP-acid ligase II